MKIKFFTLGFLCLLTFQLHTHEHSNIQERLAAPLLDEEEDNMTDAEMEALSHITPARHSVAEQWFVQRVGDAYAWYVKYKKFTRAFARYLRKKTAYVWRGRA